MELSGSELTDQLSNCIRDIFQFQSLIDSFNFELSNSIIQSNWLQLENDVKEFKLKISKQISKLTKAMKVMEVSLNSNECIQKTQRDQSTIKGLKNCLSICTERFKLLEGDRCELLMENKELKKQLDQLLRDNKVKQNELNNKTELIKKTKLDLETKKCNVDNLMSNYKVESQQMSAELNKLKSKTVEQQNSIAKLENEKAAKDAQIVQLTRTVKNLENLEKIDKTNLINSKTELNQEKEKLQNHEVQLKYDYQLINDLKINTEKLQQNISELMKENDSLKVKSKNLKTNQLNNDIEMSKIAESAKELEDLLKVATNSNAKLNEKNKRYKKELLALREENRELKNVKDHIDLDNKSLTGKLDSLTERYNSIKLKCDQLQQIQNSMQYQKSISDEKIKLLTQFLNEIKVAEFEMKNDLIEENKEIKTRLNQIRTVYEKLF